MTSSPSRPTSTPAEFVQGNPLWAEVLQLVPVVVLAFPIVTSGEVDLSQLGGAFTLASILAAATTAIVQRAGAVLNPLLVGTNLWLMLGALGFRGGIAPLATVLADYQGLVLFVAIGITAVMSMARTTGAIGAHGPASWVRSRSGRLVAACILAIAWAAWFYGDVRLGGGLPFICLNVARRIAIAHGVRLHPAPESS